MYGITPTKNISKLLPHLWSANWGGLVYFTFTAPHIFSIASVISRQWSWSWLMYRQNFSSLPAKGLVRALAALWIWWQLSPSISSKWGTFSLNLFSTPDLDIQSCNRLTHFTSTVNHLQLLLIAIMINLYYHCVYGCIFEYLWVCFYLVYGGTINIICKRQTIQYGLSSIVSVGVTSPVHVDLYEVVPHGLPSHNIATVHQHRHEIRHRNVFAAQAAEDCLSNRFTWHFYQRNDVE